MLKGEQPGETADSKHEQAQEKDREDELDNAIAQPQLLQIKDEADKTEADS